MGSRPVHLYSVNQTNSVWSHSDAEGTFYVIALTASSNLSVVAKVPVGASKFCHPTCLTCFFCK